MLVACDGRVIDQWGGCYGAGRRDLLKIAAQLVKLLLTTSGAFTPVTYAAHPLHTEIVACPAAKCPETGFYVWKGAGTP